MLAVPAQKSDLSAENLAENIEQVSLKCSRGQWWCERGNSLAFERVAHAAKRREQVIRAENSALPALREANINICRWIRPLAQRMMNMAKNKQFLYKYRHLNGKHREWTKRIITDSVLHFANPTAFNDPFDCKVHFQSSFPVEGLKRRYVDLIKKRMPGLKRKERRRKATDDIMAMNPDKFLSQITTGLQGAVDRVGVLSLSAADRNILLWSHYAAGHTGLCFKFIATNYTPFFGLALPVTYARTYPEIDVLSPPDKQFETFLLRKAEDWSYEEEWRIIDHDHGAGDKVFPAELLVGVILGARMSQEDKRAVADWAKKSRSPIEILQAYPAKGAFLIEIGQCEF